MAAVLEDIYGYANGNLTFTDENGNIVATADSIAVNQSNEGAVYTYSGTNLDFVDGDFTITIDNGPIDPAYVEDYINQGTIHNPDLKVLSPAESVLQDMVGRIRDFHQWLREEHEDLSEECGADLNGLIDRLEETFPELSEEPEEEIAVANPQIDFEGDFEHFRRQVINALRVDPADIQVGYGSDYGSLNDII